jgi:8-oxo-dGTP pyrophosphatase MutT (NUDIX family)
MSQINIACGVICEKDGKILMVMETREDEGVVFNQPVGSLELNEDVFEAARRELQEETGLEVELTSFLGAYVWLIPNGNTSIRFCFIGCVIGGELRCEVGTGIELVEPMWLCQEELREKESLYRNPVTKQCLEDYFSGIRHPLSVIKVLKNLQVQS